MKRIPPTPKGYARKWGGDIFPPASALTEEGTTGADSVQNLAAQLTDSVINTLATTLESGDTIIDGGNSFYRDDLRRAKELSTHGIRLLDCGTSGGVWGLHRGYSLMIGGDKDAVAQVEPVFAPNMGFRAD